MPRLSVEVLNVACPEASSVLEPKLFDPFLNVTVPVGVPPAEELTEAVKLTICPLLDGFSEDVKLVVVGFFCTTCIIDVEVLPTKFALPA